MISPTKKNPNLLPFSIDPTVPEEATDKELAKIYRTAKAYLPGPLFKTFLKASGVPEGTPHNADSIIAAAIRFKYPRLERIYQKQFLILADKALDACMRNKNILDAATKIKKCV